MLLGASGMDKLKSCHVAIFGVGGVGSYTVEALARSGVGTITIVDADIVDISNINRQLVALGSTIGRDKVAVMRERILDINPDCIVHAKKMFYLPENAHEIDFTEFDYVVDAVDTVSAKIDIIMRAKEARVPIISAMGAGNKLVPTKLQVADISRTSICPLARVMRRELKARGVSDGVKVVYSTEPARTSHFQLTPPEGRRSVPGSIAFVPSVSGLIIAAEVVRELSL